jgi:hypothetical protein
VVLDSMVPAQDAWPAALREVTIADLTGDVQGDTDGAAIPWLREWLGAGA